MKIEIKVCQFKFPVGQKWTTVAKYLLDDERDFKLSEFLNELSRYQGRNMRIYINGKKRYSINTIE